MCNMRQKVTQKKVHGVASGDPLSDGIIIWTRVTPRVSNISEAGDYNVTWMVSYNDDLSDPIQEGVFTTGPERDWTVKIDVCGLEGCCKQYYYGFQVGYTKSTVGTFRLPQPIGKSMDEVVYAVFSCSNWGFGYFNAYDVAARYDLDFWIHTGDYIYEYGIDTYPNPSQAVRFMTPPEGLQPQHEILTLDDYRLRHSTYRLDPALQALSAKAPMMAGWDDHEITNNPYTDGAENHQEGEGDWEMRKSDAIQVYHEWMPSRDYDEDGNYVDEFYYRSIQYGDLATLIFPETRLTARTDPNELSGLASPFALVGGIINNTDPEDWTDAQVQQFLGVKAQMDDYRNNPNKTIIGEEQMQFIAQKTNESIEAGTKWQLYPQQSVMEEWMWADLEAAIEEKREMGDSETADFWQEALYNITVATEEGTTYISESLVAHRLQHFGEVLFVDSTILSTGRNMVAFGRYKINFSFDAWQGYVANRHDFLKTISAADNAIIYGGDSHNLYAGVLTDPEINDGEVIAAEFDAGGVTAPGDWISNDWLLAALVDAGFVVGNEDMVYANRQEHGFMLATLTKEKHHIEYIYTSIDTMMYDVYCDKALDVYAADANTDSDVGFPIEGTCDPIPDVAPYAHAETAMGVGYSIV